MLVVDDSVVIRRLVTHILEQDDELQVVGLASNGSIALQRIPQLNPDLLTLDVEMPEMDGLELLRRIRLEYPHLRVIMFSTLTERGSSVTLDALTLGADDYVTKASNEGSLDRSMERLREELVPKIKQFFRMPAQVVTARVQAAARRGPRGQPFGPGHWRSAFRQAGPMRSARSCLSCRRASRCRFWWSSTCRGCSRACLPNVLTPPVS